MVSALNKG